MREAMLALGAEHSPLGNESGFEVPPESDQQFPCEGDDPDLADAAGTAPELPLIPARERALGLIPEPCPRRVDRERTDPTVPRLRDPLLVVHIATLIVR